MRETSPDGVDAKDAVLFSPHKFVGGPQTPGVLVVRRELVGTRVPSTPGGGTVAFVDPGGALYLDDPVAREEAGTPAIVESVRAGLVVALKEAVGTDRILDLEGRWWRRARERWSRNPHLEILGHPDAPRLPIVSFRVHRAGRVLHHDFVVALLDDLFGIQARGGCSCAGPYGHRLLCITPRRSAALRTQVARGYNGVKPGWARVTFAYFMSEAVVEYIVEAVDLVATSGHRLLRDYAFDPRSGHWRHRYAPAEPVPVLADLLSGAPAPHRPSARTSSPANSNTRGRCSLPGRTTWRTGPAVSRPNWRRCGTSTSRWSADADRIRPGAQATFGLIACDARRTARHRRAPLLSPSPGRGEAAGVGVAADRRAWHPAGMARGGTPAPAVLLPVVNTPWSSSEFRPHTLSGPQMVVRPGATRSRGGRTRRRGRPARPPRPVAGWAAPSSTVALCPAPGARRRRPLPDVGET